MRPVIERTPVTAQCPAHHQWSTEILPGSTMPQTSSCPECGLTVSSYPSLRDAFDTASHDISTTEYRPNKFNVEVVWLDNNIDYFHFWDGQQAQKTFLRLCQLSTVQHVELITPAHDVQARWTIGTDRPQCACDLTPDVARECYCTET